MQEVIDRLLEAATRPGLFSLAGMALEKRCERELRSYFTIVARAVVDLHLEQLTKSEATAGGAYQFAEMRVSHVLRGHRATLLGVLASNLYAAYTLALKMDNFAEAAKDDKKRKRKKEPEPEITVAGIPVARLSGADLDRLGLTGRKAADWAAKHAATLVQGVDATTRKEIAAIVSKGIRDRLGNDAVARLIRNAVDDMTSRRAKLIASTEMNNAMSTATMEKLKAIGIKYKQLIISPDEATCVKCNSIWENGPVPVDKPFVDEEGNEYAHTPIHPRCRCATTGARTPGKEEGF